MREKGDTIQNKKIYIRKRMYIMRVDDAISFALEFNFLVVQQYSLNNSEHWHNSNSFALRFG